MKTAALIIGLQAALAGFAVSAAAQHPVSPVPDWAGTWKGELINLPLREGAAPVAVQIELGEFPVTDNTCSVWRNTYYDGEGAVALVKDYQLCRGSGANDLFVDEGDGVKLTARWLGDVLVSPFKYDNTLLISTLRLRGDRLEEEIITAEDKPAVDGVQSMTPRGIQRLVLRRVVPPSKDMP